MKNTIAFPLRLLVLGCLSGSSSLWASGIFLDFQNGAGTGNAFAGAAASAEDASTVFFNPAGMTRLKPGHHTALALSGVSIDSKYEDRGTTPLSPSIPVGDRSAEIHRTAVVPAAYYVGTVMPDLQVGFGISPLYANEGSWPGGFAGRYQGSDSKIHVIDYNPSLAYRINDAISIGLGLNYLDIDAELSRAIPFTVNGDYAGDGELTVKGKDSGWGYNLGILWQVTADARVGLSYRETTPLEIEGETVRSTSADQRLVIPGEAKIDVPEMISLALAYEWGQWEFLEDISWSNWSVTPGIYVQSRDTNFELFREELDFRDAWRFGTGANYRYDDKTKLRLGFAYDQSVVRNPQSRTVRFPDNNRKWVGVGVNYQIAANTTIDAGYAHVFVSDTRINRQTEYDIQSSQVLRGDISSTGNVFSLQWNQQW